MHPARAHRPITCPVCRTDLPHPDEDCVTVVHCTCCGNTWTEHLAHTPLRRERCGDGGT